MAEIFTTKGMLEESLLAKTTGEIDNDNEHTTWTEYRLGDELVRRDVHVALKQGMDLLPVTEGL